MSLVGGLLLVSGKRLRKSAKSWAHPFGASALLAASFLSILPEALEHSGSFLVLQFALAGFLVFFVLERLVGWFHHHHHDDVHGSKDKTHVAMVVVGDTLHNAIDGIAIGSAFLINPALGITTSLAVAAHEIPQEIGDFGILLGKGLKPKRVVIINLISAGATVVMALLTFWLAGMANIDPAPLMAVAAGMFIYIAASDLIPDIHEKPQREGNLQALMLLVGVVVIGVATMLMPHEHAPVEHREGQSVIEADHHDHEHEHGHDRELDHEYEHAH